MNETQHIEFDFTTENQDHLVIYGEKNGLNVKFKAVNQYGQIVPKSKLSVSDVESINDLIYENAIQEVQFFQDWGEKQHD